MKNETILSSSERVCAECGKKFTVHSSDLWAYKLSVKGRTIWFCRYNCVRAGEKKHKFKDARGGNRPVLKNKPTKEVLEADLKSGLSGPELAKKYNCSNSTVHNWVKEYGLQKLQAVRKPKGEPIIINTPPVDDMVQTPPPDDMVQHSPTLNEIEQFHTDEPVQELPVVEIEAEPGGVMIGIDLSTKQDQTGTSEVWGSPILTAESYTHNEHKVEAVEMNPSEMYHVPPESQGMTAEENMTDEEWEAQKSDPITEAWQGFRAHLSVVENSYIERSKSEFREHLREMLAEIVGDTSCS